MTTSDSDAVLSPSDGAHAQLAVTLVTAAQDGYRAMHLAWLQAVAAAQDPAHPLHATFDLEALLWWLSRSTVNALDAWQADRPDRADVAGGWLAGTALGYMLMTDDGA